MGSAGPPAPHQIPLTPLADWTWVHRSPIGYWHDHILRFLVVAQSEEDRLPQLSVRRPLLKGDLGDEAGRQVGHLTLTRGVNEGRGFPDQRLEIAKERGQHAV